MLSQEQVQFYEDNGYISVSGVLTDAEIAELQDVTNGFLERSRAVTESDDTFDLEPGHTADAPRLRRIKRPINKHPLYKEMLSHPGIIAILQQLMGTNIRHYGLKINLKPGGGGEPVEWHQDWAYYPHTNDDLCVVGIMLDDVTEENGALLVVPGSHKGPVLDHHQDGVFVGAVTDPRAEAMYADAVPLTGKIGDITIHHTRTLHGSPANISDGYRRIVFLTLRAADAWPLTDMPNLDDFNDMIVAGEAPVQPRMENIPVRLPLPRPDDWLIRRDSIFEKQRDLRNSPFARGPSKKAEPPLAAAGD
jgi:phytanoyl-CoA hydroxylase